MCRNLLNPGTIYFLPTHILTDILTGRSTVFKSGIGLHLVSRGRYDAIENSK